VSVLMHRRLPHNHVLVVHQCSTSALLIGVLQPVKRLALVCASLQVLLPKNRGFVYCQKTAAALARFLYQYFGVVVCVTSAGPLKL
jgi:hypothetical protein